MSKKTRKRMDELMAAMRAEYTAIREAAAHVADGPRDEVYYSGLPDEAPLEAAENITLLFTKD